MTMIKISRAHVHHPESEAAIEAARRSHEQAERDLAQQAELAVPVRRVVDKLRAHNVANNYTDWLIELVAKRR